jgi:hypothetical protein
MPDAPVTAESQPEETPAGNADTPEASEPEPTVTIENGRRRGKRRVMKKKKVKDEDGYLGKRTRRHSHHSANHLQSLRRKLSGSPSRKKNRSRRNSNLRRSQQAAQRANLRQRRDKAASPASSRKPKRPEGPSACGPVRTSFRAFVPLYTYQVSCDVPCRSRELLL